MAIDIKSNNCVVTILWTGDTNRTRIHIIFTLEISVLSSIKIENLHVCKYSTSFCTSCLAIIRVIIFLHFFWANVRSWTVLESTQIFFNSGIKWSAVLKAKLCSAKNAATLISARLTLSLCVRVALLLSIFSLFGKLHYQYVWPSVNASLNRF